MLSLMYYILVCWIGWPSEEEKNKGGSYLLWGRCVNNYDVAHYKSVLIFYFDGD
jgi:hypothetical protein